MHLFSQAAWSVVALLACLGAIVDAATSEIVEIDLVFPRNETYAPTDSLPVVLAFQNAKLLPDLFPQIRYTIRNHANLLGDDAASFSYLNLRWADLSGQEPHFEAAFFKDFATEGHWQLQWQVFLQSCDQDSFIDSSGTRGAHGIGNQSVSSLDFTIKNGGQPADLVAATAGNKACPEQLGLAVNITTLEVAGETCGVMASTTPTPSPCQVKIDSAVAASISASWAARLCDSLMPPADCTAESASQRLAVAAVASWAAAFGALGFFLA